MDIQERIKANTDLVIAQLGPESGIDFGLNAESVSWVEGFIERQRDHGDLSVETIDRLISVFGSFLGECIIANYGGRWQEHERDLGICFGDQSFAFPFSKVRKQFEHGVMGGDSIRSLYNVIPALFADLIKGESNDHS